VAKTGRRRLTWVTALTVASLLVGSTALNALADNGRSGGGHGNDHGKAEHAQTVDTANKHDDHALQSTGDEHHGNGNASANGNASVSVSSNHGNGNGNGGSGDGDDDRGRRETSTPTTTTTTTVTMTPTEEPEDMDRDDVDEDLVSPPERVSEEVRPGLGCGDADDHSGAPGNPDKVCKHPHDNDGDAAATSTTSDTDDDSSVATSDTGD
jgi:hypothetical protein